MSDLGEQLSSHGDLRKAKRAAMGINCPACAKARPRANATILLPGQRCRVDGYRDPRPEPTIEEWNTAMAAKGLEWRMEQPE